VTEATAQRRVAVVTGAGSGVGEAIARVLHGGGYRIMVADIDAAAAQGVADTLDATGETAMAQRLDVREKPQFEAALAAATARWGTVHALVNNAAVTVARPVMEISPEEFDAVIAVNLRGTFLGCQVFGSYFKTCGHGRIINLASLAGQNGGTATGAHYAASKGGIITLTKVFARDLGPSGVTVNAIAPGPIDSPMVHRTLSPERLQAVKATIPVGEIGDAGFIGKLVLQLASPEAAFATGATWDVNGGIYLR
jgi:3-oxoacyl-[acyl-carrier protein] reductase